MAEAYSHLGDKGALAWLNRAADEKHPAIFAINDDPDYESLHSDPRFAELVRRIQRSR